MLTLQPAETFTVAEMASAWRLSERTVRRMCETGRLPHHRVGSSIRFTPADVAAIDASTSIRQEAS